MLREGRREGPLGGIVLTVVAGGELDGADDVAAEFCQESIQVLIMAHRALKNRGRAV